MKNPFHSSPPAHWFKPVHAAKDELGWLDIDALIRSGITHWRVVG